MDLDDIADELYGLDPGEFTAARSEHVARAREAGDRELAAAVGRLRKPTVSAWLVNMLVREKSEEVTALLGLGDALRSAQRQLSGSELRRLSTQRRRVIGALEKTAARLAAEHGRRASEAALREVGQTLHAALADADLAEQVRGGRLEAPLDYSGFGPVGLSVVPPPPARTDTEADEAERTRRAAALETAVAEAEAARNTADEAQSVAARARAAVEELDGHVARLREELSRVEQRREFARRTARSADEDAAKAEDAARQAEEAVRALREQD
ncbi:MULTISPECIES: hypothetical protein [Rhodococcus]|uniref:hypothetical protein n=1 Tax=Rhodococcus TaxID=1827 RepID=UPI0002D21BE9|nr:MULTISPECIES: hypothetical protein [Rhodococcus]AKE89278.1 hypothetical protein AAT18_08510 [Rhodococcus aetherivorans]KDE14293.1 hypothetical protein N505_0105615 [Rhodococcus aetherivorans]MBC2590942.1 hypothetical protein [Rhodococcus aetherivorans]MDV6292528.1 hypothetical protein [Rhodococcus aetherivorans]OLL18189.1 hypothetical protein BKE56_016705 [Rhodococcus sp. M8]